MFELVMYKRMANGDKTKQKVSMSSMDAVDLEKFFIKTVGRKRKAKARKK